MIRRTRRRRWRQKTSRFTWTSMRSSPSTPRVFALSVDDARKRVLKAHELASVVHRPRTHAQYADADLAHQAAVLAHGIAEGQLFVDGNKRTALEAMRLFLRLNDVDLDARQHELAEWILDLSRGGTVEDLAARISSHLVDR